VLDVTSAVDEDRQQDFRQLRRQAEPDLRERLIVEHRWLATHCARRFEHRGEPFEDLEQVALLGLVKAVERFDPDHGSEFPSFAIPTVLGELRRHFRDATWALKVPRRLKDLSVRLGSSTQELTAALGRTPTVDELADHIGATVEDVLEAMEARTAYRTNDIDPPQREGGAPPAEVRAAVEDPGFGSIDAQLTVEELVQHLPERERTIVRLRYFHGLSQSEIARRVGLSQVHVSRLLSASLERLQHVHQASEAS
jgi:RNA polymerase sigma-B factor